MCGRFSLISEMGELQGRFEFDGAGLPHTPRYNIAPCIEVLVDRRQSLFRRGRVLERGRDLSLLRNSMRACTDRLQKVQDHQKASLQR